MTAAPKRRWFQWSLRTLFLVVTVFCCWLGWNLSWVRERERVRQDIGWRGATIRTPGFHADVNRRMPKTASPTTMPAIWTFLGAEPWGSIDLPESEFTEDDRRRIQALFPEADVSIPRIPPGGHGVM
jgi:hypothetical protein